jgi:hypothetical protein
MMGEEEVMTDAEQDWGEDSSEDLDQNNNNNPIRTSDYGLSTEII